MFPSSSRRPWVSLAVSAAMHAGLFALAVHLSHERVETPAERRVEETEPARQVRMVYLDPPPEPPRPVPPRPEPPPPAPEPTPAPVPRPRPPRPVAPAPEKEQRTAEPDANAPPEAARSEGEERETDAPEGGRNAGAAARSSAESEMAATMESEARRIFGRPRPGPLPGAGPRAVRPMEAILPENAERCVPTPRSPAESAGAPQYGVVVGRIFRKDDGRPLAGAHLQMLGTPYVTFTDATGEYRFRFDLALVENCRTQYVRVTADGYESRLLVLVVGDNVRSEDVLLKRN